MGRDKQNKPKKVRVSAESNIRAAREVRTYGFDIPKFGFKSAILIFVAALLAMFLPDLAGLIGVNANALQVFGGTILVTSAVFVSQYVIEKRTTVTWKTVIGYVGLFLAILMIFYFWVYVQMPI